MDMSFSYFNLRAFKAILRILAKHPAEASCTSGSRDAIVSIKN